LISVTFLLKQLKSYLNTQALLIKTLLYLKGFLCQDNIHAFEIKEMEQSSVTCSTYGERRLSEFQP